MLKKNFLIVLFLLLILIINCNNKIIWRIKTPIDIQYIFNIDNKIYCFSLKNGYIEINKDGKIIKTIVFNKNDKRNNIETIKILPFNGIYGYYYDKNKNIWLVEINDDIKIKQIVRLNNEVNYNNDFLISKRNNNYCVFNTWLAPDDDKPQTHNWINIKNNDIDTQIKYFSSGDGIIYYIDNKYYDMNLINMKIINNKGDIEKEIFWKEHYNIENKFTNSLNFNKKKLNNFIYGDDNYFYLLLVNIKKKEKWEFESWQYYILKIDNNLELIGKRLINNKLKFEGRCVSGIYVDKKGYIYISSDMDKTITKYNPINKGEDSIINLD